LMARRITRRRHVVLSGGLHPEYVQTVRTYVTHVDEGGAPMDIVPVGADNATDPAAVAERVTPDTAAIVVGYPNFFGCVEDLAALKKIAAERGALLVTATAEPYALSVLKAPGSFGADIAVGEGQAL